jgi:dTDP-4-dehydrorhamnose 3,5-epimerase
MEITKSKLDNVLIIKPPTISEDFRGSYVELFNDLIYKEAGINQNFVQDDISTSSQHVLRGIHGNGKTWKLVSCLYGKFYLVVINNDTSSPQFRQWESFVLSDQNRLQVLIPPKFGNGHVVLSPTAIFHYKQTTYYERASQFTLRWNDPELKIWWPVKNPLVSPRDEGME